ncbi:AbrB/MazE/SpoVT family DNA-binding domain-containing protein [Candidatus Saccharibacteria bacterium]|nr:MAG: AbrB/MazE/SpoVT family DNA-binding domain-containing protein [Candidatus Saccharibacteria bacterium]
MTFTTIQKAIKIGTSRGVILPAKELKRLNIGDDDELELIVRKKTDVATNDEVMAAAEDIMSKYRQAFKNLANR